MTDEESTPTVPDGYTPIIASAGFTEEVEEVEVNLDALRHTDIIPSWWGDTPMPKRAPKRTDFGGHVTIAQAAESVDEKELASSAGGVAKKAKALGWNVSITKSITHHTDLLFVKNGKTGDSGDVRTPAHDETHLVIAAVDTARTTGFSATWDDGKPTGFRIVDPVGIPIENFVDYWRLKESVKPVEDYNDGTDRIVHRHFFAKITPFNDWLTDWLELLAPESAPKRKAPKKTKEENLLEGADWNG